MAVRVDGPSRPCASSPAAARSAPRSAAAPSPGGTSSASSCAPRRGGLAGCRAQQGQRGAACPRTRPALEACVAMGTAREWRGSARPDVAGRPERGALHVQHVARAAARCRPGEAERKKKSAVSNARRVHFAHAGELNTHIAAPPIPLSTLEQVLRTLGRGESGQGRRACVSRDCFGRISGPVPPAVANGLLF